MALSKREIHLQLRSFKGSLNPIYLLESTSDAIQLVYVHYGNLQNVVTYISLVVGKLGHMEETNLCVRMRNNFKVLEGIKCTRQR